MMNSRVISWSCAVAICLGSVLANPAAATVTITAGETYALVSDGGTAQDVDDLFGTTDATATASLPGLFSQTLRSATAASITATFNQFRTGSGGVLALGIVRATFDVDADTTYALGGSFANTSGQTFLFSSLFDQSTATYLFDNYQDNHAFNPFTANLGATNGNLQNQYAGSLTGTLLAGHTYEWLVHGQTGATYATDDGATATGSAILSFGDDPPTEIVPEPASIAVWACLGLTATGLGWRRRRRPGGAVSASR